MAETPVEPCQGEGMPQAISGDPSGIRDQGSAAATTRLIPDPWPLIPDLDGQAQDQPTHFISLVRQGPKGTRNLAVHPHPPVIGGKGKPAGRGSMLKRLVPVPAYTILASALLFIMLGMTPSANAQDQLLNWSEVGIGNFYINTPAVGDLDGDGRLDIVVSASGCSHQTCASAQAGIVMALSHDLNPLPGWPIQTNQAGGPLPPTPPIVTDLDADDRAEVLLGHAHSFYVLTGEGQLRWQKTVNEFFRKRAQVADLDGDGQPEIVVPADQYTGQAKIYIWRWDGEPFPGSPLRLDEFYASPPAIHRQGQHTRLAVGGGNGFMQAEGTLYLFALDETDGVLRLGWRQPVGPHPITQPVFADLDGDGHLEILGGTYAPSVYAVRAVDGSPVSGWPRPVGGSVFGSPAILDEDGQKRIFAIALDGSLYAWDSQGHPLWTLMLAPNAIEQITLADVDRDGQPNLVLGVNGGVIAVDLHGRVIRQWRIGDAWVTGVLAVEFLPGHEMIVFGSVDNVTEQAKLALFQL